RRTTSLKRALASCRGHFLDTEAPQLTSLTSWNLRCTQWEVKQWHYLSSHSGCGTKAAVPGQVHAPIGSRLKELPLRLHHNAYDYANQERARHFYEDIVGLPLVAT